MASIVVAKQRACRVLKPESKLQQMIAEFRRKKPNKGIDTEKGWNALEESV